jgi:ribonuclease Y
VSVRELEELVASDRHAQQAELERVARMTAAEARETLLRDVEEATRHDMAKLVRRVEEEARHESDRRVRSIIATAIQRLAAAHASATTASTVALPSTTSRDGSSGARAGTSVPSRPSRAST